MNSRNKIPQITQILSISFKKKINENVKKKNVAQQIIIEKECIFKLI